VSRGPSRRVILRETTRSLRTHLGRRRGRALEIGPVGMATTSGNLEDTRALLERIRGGDEAARDVLVRRFLPGLHRWARGRLPDSARDLMDTNDLVSVALVRVLHRADRFDPGSPGSFFAYLRTAVLNCLRDELRRVGRRPERVELPPELVDDRPTALERTLGGGLVERYEKALGALTPDQQQAVILRIEFGFTYPEIAQALGRNSGNSVRMQVSRSILRLAEVMDVPS
jgi:RNA polymerase sigma factor (sigma-70 family)